MENRIEEFDDDSSIRPISGQESSRVYSNRFATSVVSGRISWGGVVAGLFIAMAVQLTLMLLPLSFGMAFLGPESPGSGAAMGWTTAVMQILTMAISLFIGSFIAAKLSNIPQRSTGMFHGLAVWALAVLFNFILLGQFFTGVASGVASAVKGLSSMEMNISFVDTLPEGFRNELQKYNLDLEDLRNEIGQVLNQTGNPQLTEEALVEEVDQVSAIAVDSFRNILLTPEDAGEEFEAMINQIVAATRDTWGNVTTQDLANVISARSDLNQQQAFVVAQRWKRQIDEAVNEFGANIRQAKQQIVTRSDQAMDQVAQVSLFTFIALVVGAALAIFAGFLGTPSSTNLAYPDRLH